MASVHILNVGEGDCSIIQHKDNKVTVIDCCNVHNLEEGTNGFTNPLPVLAGMLKGKGRVFRYIQTHPDMDHMDGLSILFNKLGITNFWDVDNNKELIISKAENAGRYKEEDWKCYQTLRVSRDNPKALNYYAGSANKYFAYDDEGNKLSDDFIQILSPSKEMVQRAKDNKVAEWNDYSYVLLYHIEGRKVLFCGDIEGPTMDYLLKNHKRDIEDIDVLIAPHHGRKREDGDYSYLDLIHPRLVICEDVEGDFMSKSVYEDRRINYISKRDAHDVMLDFTEGKILVMCANKAYAAAYVLKRNNLKLPQSVVYPGWIIDLL